MVEPEFASALDQLDSVASRQVVPRLRSDALMDASSSLLAASSAGVSRVGWRYACLIWLVRMCSRSRDASRSISCSSPT